MQAGEKHRGGCIKWLVSHGQEQDRGQKIIFPSTIKIDKEGKKEQRAQQTFRGNPQAKCERSTKTNTPRLSQNGFITAYTYTHIYKTHNGCDKRNTIAEVFRQENLLTKLNK